MDKLKQRVYDVLSNKKNLRMLKTRIQILKDEISTKTDGMTEAEQQWIEKAYKDLKTATEILEGRNMVGKKCVFSGSCGSASSSKTSKILRVITETLREGVDLSSNFFGLSYCKNLKSRENMLQEILEASMNTYINMIGIYGMIGVGKTTLVIEIERRAQNNKLFDAVVMVPVSYPLDVMLIQNQIANKIGLRFSKDDDEETRAQLLKTKFDEKVVESGQEHTERVTQQRKILVIFDGIQHATDLDKVGIPYGRKGHSRFMFVLVSRNVDVCKKVGAQENFLVECLNSEEAKILFRERLVNKIRNIDIAVESERYERVENGIVKKCGGLPSMINSLAYALWTRSHSDWEIIAYHLETHTLLEVDEIIKEVPYTMLGTHLSDRSKWLPEVHNGGRLKNWAKAILELCNNFIQKGDDDKHKLFLLICCLIQQDADLSLEKIMRYSIGFGLFDVDPAAYVLDQINPWVDELKLPSLLMESKKPQHVKMHRIVQEVAIFALSQGDYSLLQNKGRDYSLPVLMEACTGWETRESYENCVALSMTPDGNFNCLNGLELPQLEAFLLKGTTGECEPSSILPDTFFQGMHNLKILDISKIRHLPSSIGYLKKNLVTLHLEDCYISDDGVRSMICNLARLQVLSLRESTLGTLPDEIGKLTNLRVLDLTGCELHTCSVDGVAKMGRLRELYLLFGRIKRKWSTDDLKKLLPFLPLEGFEIEIPNSKKVFPDSINFPTLRRFRISLGGGRDLLPTGYSRALLVHQNYSRLQLEESGLKDLMSRAEYLHIKEAPDMDLKESIADLNINGGFPILRELRLDGLNKLRHVLPLRLGVQLRVMQVSYCKSLLHIFSRSDESIVELPFMEKLELKVLTEMTSLLALQDLPEASTTREDFQITRHVLFNDKMKLLSLKELHLEDLHQIWNVWDLLGSEDACWNLKNITISRCDKLESVFPFWIANSFLHLEKLEVDKCANLKEVITSIDYTEAEADTEEDTNPTTINFPKLHTLTLRSLSSLECFGRGSVLLEFPNLGTLHLSDLKKMKAFRLPNTESLQTQCMPTALFDGVMKLPSLKELHLEGLHQISNVWDLLGSEDACWKTPCFGNLKEVKISSCDKLESVFPSWIANSLFHLEKLKVEICRNMKEVITSIDYTEVEEDTNPTTTINFLRIYTLKLRRLSSLECFGRGSFLLEFPKLKRLHLSKLEKIKAFTLPNTESLQTQGMPTALFDGVMKLPSLEELRLLGLHQIWNLWALYGSEDAYRKSPWFGNLWLITISRCDKLESVFPFWIANSFLHLEKLEVDKCANLKEVITSIDYTEAEADTEEDTNPTTINFPKLHTLTLRSLSSLECFGRGSVLLEFPNLGTLHLSDLKKMKAFRLPNTESLQTQCMPTALFDGVMKLLSLEELHLEGLHQIWNVWDLLGSEDACWNLKKITISRCDKLESVFWIANSLLHLQKLEVDECANLKEFSTSIDYTDEGEADTNPTTTINFPQLYTLTLLSLSSLQCFGRGRLLLKFPKLWKLHLFKLEKMKAFTLPNTESLRSQGKATALFDGLEKLHPLNLYDVQVGGNSSMSTTLLAGGREFPKLQDIKVEKCYDLEAITSGDVGADLKSFIYGKTPFSYLNSIYFKELPKLRTFSMGNYETTFPSLQTVEITDCNSMQCFSFGRIWTPKLRKVKLGDSTYSADRKRMGDINEIFLLSEAEAKPAAVEAEAKPAAIEAETNPAAEEEMEAWESEEAEEMEAWESDEAEEMEAWESEEAEEMEAWESEEAEEMEASESEEAEEREAWESEEPEEREAQKAKMLQEGASLSSNFF